jgi:diguanylate cyclase (GGDEF)-like protein/PAS domain S-box-containing protein
VIISPSLEIHAFNTIMHDRLGYTKYEINKMTLYDICPSINIAQDWIDIELELKNRNSITFETNHLKKNGDIIPMEINLSSIMPCSIYSPYYIAIARDMRLKKENDTLKWSEANIDHLTKLPNRKLFNHDVILSIKKPHEKYSIIAILYIDLDDFKIINDRYGHSIGDEVLVAISSRLNNCIRTNDCISRFGGDEFVIILFDLKTEGSVMPILDKILGQFDHTIRAGHYDITLNASVGVHVSQRHEFELDKSLTKADFAMYKAKQKVGTTRSFYRND